MIQPEFIRKLLAENTTYLVKTLEFFGRVDGLLTFSAPFRHCQYTTISNTQRLKTAGSDVI